MFTPYMIRTMHAEIGNGCLLPLHRYLRLNLGKATERMPRIRSDGEWTDSGRRGAMETGSLQVTGSGQVSWRSPRSEDGGR